jgi:hypothetical protein
MSRVDSEVQHGHSDEAGRNGVDRSYDIQVGSKCFTKEEFFRIQRSSNFIGAVAFWRALEKLASPEPRTCFHAIGVLRELTELRFDECLGVAYSPQEAECLRYCGLTPTGVRPPGAVRAQFRAGAREGMLGKRIGLITTSSFMFHK